MLNTYQGNWSIHAPSGHCRHKAGFDAFFQAPTGNSKAIKLTEPYGTNTSVKFDPQIMVELSRSLEMLTGPSNYAVWGRLCESGSTSKQINIMGQDTGWKPILALRTSLELQTFPNNPILDPEWSYNSEHQLITHVSGLTTSLGKSVPIGVLSHQDEEIWAKEDTASIQALTFQAARVANYYDSVHQDARSNLAFKHSYLEQIATSEYPL